MSLVGGNDRTGWSHNGSPEKTLNDSAFDDSISMITPMRAQTFGHMAMCVQADGHLYGSPAHSRSSAGKFETSSESGVSIHSASLTVVLQRQLNFAQCVQR